MTKRARLGLVLTNLEKAAVRRLAEEDGGLSQAALIRRLIRAEAERRGFWSLGTDRSATPGGRDRAVLG